MHINSHLKSIYGEAQFSTHKLTILCKQPISYMNINWSHAAHITHLLTTAAVLDRHYFVLIILNHQLKQLKFNIWRNSRQKWRGNLSLRLPQTFMLYIQRTLSLRALAREDTPIEKIQILGSKYHECM